MAHPVFSAVKVYSLADEQGLEYCALVRNAPGNVDLIAYDVTKGYWNRVRLANEKDMQFFAAHNEPNEGNELRLTMMLQGGG